MKCDKAKVLIVILNYQTYKMTIELVENLKQLQYESYDIMVVDNCSPNESAVVLQENAEKYGYIFYANETNAGYAAGNNIGIRYAVEHGYQYSWILNNDVKIENWNLLSMLVDIAENDKSIGAVGPQIIDINGFATAPYVERQSFWDMTLGIALSREKRKEYQNYSGEVYRIYGCCMLLNNYIMNAVDYMDERTFLYYEEEILAEKMHKIGAKIYYCADTSIIHLESMTVKKAYGRRNLKKIKIMLESMDLYLKEYRNFSFIKRLICKMVRGLIIVLRG